MNPTNSRVAIVTGASRGIGAAIARRLGREGFSVIINYAGSVDTADSLAAEISKGRSRALAVQADVSKRDEVKRLFDAAEKEFGGVDVLVNNAGIMLLSSIAESTDEQFDRQIAINHRQLKTFKRFHDEYGDYILSDSWNEIVRNEANRKAKA